jgi:hypothetical protein
MKKIFTIASICALLASPAFAQEKKPDNDAAGEAQETTEAPSAAEVDKAAKAIDTFADDQKKVEGYCTIAKEMGTLKEGDDKKAEELTKKMDDYLASVDKDLPNAFQTAEAVDPETEDGKKVDAAFTKLEGKCTK